MQIKTLLLVVCALLPLVIFVNGGYNDMTCGACDATNENILHRQDIHEDFDHDGILDKLQSFFNMDDWEHQFNKTFKFPLEVSTGINIGSAGLNIFFYCIFDNRTRRTIVIFVVSN